MAVVVELCGLIMLNSLPVALFAVVAHFACGALDYRVPSKGSVAYEGL